MINELNQAIEEYYGKWDALVAARGNQAFFRALKPTSAGWKTEDIDEFNRLAFELREKSEQVHFGWINERWLGTFYLRDSLLPHGLRVIKLMQRRPGSQDTVGLDHLDFYAAPESGDLKAVMAAENGLNWTEEKNGEHCKWISIWFEGTEAKIRKDTVLDVCAQELKEYAAGLLT